nr:reverse transcriptase domain-containing protein [Tanacetum cinerariifolium]
EYVREGASFARLGRPAFDAALREYCNRNYHQLLPIIAEKVHQEKVHQEKLKAVKTRLNFEEASQHSESGTPSRRRDLKKRLGSRHVCSMFGSPKPRRGHSESPRKRDPERKTVFKRLEKDVFHRLGDKGKRRLSEPTKFEAKGGQVRPPQKDTKRNFCFRQSKVETTPANDNPSRKKNAGKFCEFHGEVGHTTNECMHLKRKINEILSRKAVTLIKELKQSNRKDQAKTKKGKTSRKDKPLAILMVQQWQSVAKQKITQTFSSESVISFPPFGKEDGTEGPMIIEVEMRGHCVHRMYVNEGSSSEILYEHCFNRFRLENHRKSRIKEDPSSSIYSSWNAKIPSDRQNGHIARPVDMTGVPRHIEQEVIRDIEETFKTLEEINMKLNPKKCTFGIREGTFLGWKVNADGLKAHTIIVITDQPIKKILSNPKITGRLLKWSFELEEHDIHFRLTTSVKGQILADFIAERLEDDPPNTPMEDKEELPDPWILFTDRSSCKNGSGAGLILTSPKGMEFTYALRFRFDATNNKAGYEALIAGLHIAKQMGVKNLQENVDSRLLANQEVLAVVEEEGRTWMTPIYEYLAKEILPEEKRKARAIRRKAGRYAMANGIMYKRSLGEGIKERLDERRKNWLEEISHVFWAHRTMIKSSNGETSFSLTYKRKAVIPVETGMPTLRTAEEAKSKDMMEKYYNARVRNISFKLGDLVYQSNEARHAEDRGKLGPKWEGPYKVTKVLGKGAYKLKDRNGNMP